MHLQCTSRLAYRERSKAETAGRPLSMEPSASIEVRLRVHFKRN